jgi:hypothetical protein
MILAWVLMLEMVATQAMINLSQHIASKENYGRNSLQQHSSKTFLQWWELQL